jgi:hypothetical protein
MGIGNIFEHIANPILTQLNIHHIPFLGAMQAGVCNTLTGFAPQYTVWGIGGVDGW